MAASSGHLKNSEIICQREDLLDNVVKPENTENRLILGAPYHQEVSHPQQNQQPLQSFSKTRNRNVLFIGNPGVGKSTLLNSLLKSVGETTEFFKSGVSIVRGLTHHFKAKVAGGIRFLDTPGLQDVEMRKNAAEAITNALRMGGQYQVVFVITLEAGRIRPADITCIEMVLECTKNQITYYGVIINKLSKAVYNRLIANEEQQQKILSQITLTKEDHIPRIMLPILLQKIAKLEDEDNVVIVLPEVNQLLNNLPPVEIDPKVVDKIPDDDTFERYTEELESQLKEMKEDEAKMKEKMESDQMKYARDLAKMEREENKKLEEEKVKLQKQTEEHQKASEEWNRRFQEEMKLIKQQNDSEIKIKELKLRYEEEIKLKDQQLQYERMTTEHVIRESQMKIAVLEEKKKSKNIFQEGIAKVVSFFGSLA